MPNICKRVCACAGACNGPKGGHPTRRDLSKDSLCPTGWLRIMCLIAPRSRKCSCLPPIISSPCFLRLTPLFQSTYLVPVSGVRSGYKLFLDHVSGEPPPPHRIRRPEGRTDIYGNGE